MVLEEYIVVVRGHTGNNQREFTYWVDPHKKPNIKSVLKDFKVNSQIQNIDQWKLCTLGGNEIRFLADYADRILVLTPTKSPSVKLPSISTAASYSTSSTDSDFAGKSEINSKVRHLSKSSSTLPSLSPNESSTSINRYRSKSIDNAFPKKRRHRRNRADFADDVENSRDRSKQQFATTNSRHPKENKAVR